MPPGSPDRYAALRAMLATPPPAGSNMVIVGHAYPIYTPQGAAFEVVARVGLKQWRELAQLPPESD